MEIISRKVCSIKSNKEKRIMYITLTNSAIVHRGNKISININLIATVHQALVTRENDVMENVTFVFCPPHGTWEVAEPLEQVVKELNELSKK